MAENHLRVSDIKVFLPTKNEDKSISNVISELKKEGFNNIIVIDGHSTDNTRKIAKKLGIKTFIDDGNSKASAFKVMAENTKNSDIVAIMDADFTYAAADLLKLVKYMREKNADILIGNRLFLRNFFSIGPIHFFGNLFLTIIFNLLWKRNIHDICSGMRVIRGDILKKIKFSSKGFDIEAELTANFMSNNSYIVKEIPIRYRHRIGKSKIKTRHGFNILNKIIKDYVKFKNLGCI